MSTDARALRLYLWSIAAAACALGLPGLARSEAGASAADAGDAVSLDEVVVTARRRAEPEFDVPASVVAISGSSLSASALTSIQDIVSFVPNANVTDNPNGYDTYVSIRGVTQSDVNAEANFGAYRNGIFDGGHRVNLGPQVDVSQVEVLRGPQGGLYGRDAVGGAVNIVYAMPAPGDTFNGYTTADIGNDRRERVEAAATIPLGDSVATRATVWYMDQGKGDYYNIYLQNYIDRSKNEGGRFSVAAALSPVVTALGTVEFEKSEGPSLLTYAPNGVANGIGVVSPDETPMTVQRDTDSRIDVNQLYTSAKLTYTASVGTLILQGSFKNYRDELTIDQDHTALQPSAGPLTLKEVADWSESIRQDFVEALWESDSTLPLSWQAGVSYFHEDFDLAHLITTTLDTAYLGAFGVPDIGDITGTAGLPNAGSSITTHSISGFVDVSYRITQQLAVTGTVRYSQDKESLNYSQGIIAGDTVPAYAQPITAALFGPQVPTFSLASDNTYSYTSPSVNVGYKVNPNINLYVLYSTGYRPGGYNTTVTNPAEIPYGQETARNYEAGIKTRWLDGRAALNLSVFHMDQKDLTIAQTDLTSDFNFSYLANVGKARTNGAELEAMIRPDTHWTGSLGVGYLDPRYSQGTVNAGTPSAIDLTGRYLSGVRPLTMNAQIDFRTPISPAMELFASTSVRRETGGAIGDDSTYYMAPLTLLNLSAGLTVAKNTRVTIYDHNATNKMVPQFLFNTGDFGTNIGRRYGVQLTQHF
jgi:iron complex outermembrane receptor protein